MDSELLDEWYERLKQREARIARLEWLLGRAVKYVVGRELSATDPGDKRVARELSHEIDEALRKP